MTMLEIANLPFLDGFISQNRSELYLLHAYGFSENVLAFINSHLKHIKQNAKTEGVCNSIHV